MFNLWIPLCGLQWRWRWFSFIFSLLWGFPTVPFGVSLYFCSFIFIVDAIADVPTSPHFAPLSPSLWPSPHCRLCLWVKRIPLAHPFTFFHPAPTHCPCLCFYFVSLVHSLDSTCFLTFDVPGPLMKCIIRAFSLGVLHTPSTFRPLNTQEKAFLTTALWVETPSLKPQLDPAQAWNSSSGGSPRFRPVLRTPPTCPMMGSAASPPGNHLLWRHASPRPTRAFCLAYSQMAHNHKIPTKSLAWKEMMESRGVSA